MGLTLPKTDSPPPPSGAEWNMDSLSEALRRESKLLKDLVEVLKRQRSAVARDDLAVVDETVYSAQRVFRTLAEARRQRRALFEILGVDQEVGLESLEDVVGPRMTDELRLASAELREAAQKLSGELSVNRQILRGAIASGDELIRGLKGGSGRSAGVYDAQTGVQPASGDGGLIINRQI